MKEVRPTKVQQSWFCKNCMVLKNKEFLAYCHLLIDEDFIFIQIFNDNKKYVENFSGSFDLLTKKTKLISKNKNKFNLIVDNNKCYGEGFYDGSFCKINIIISNKIEVKK